MKEYLTLVQAWIKCNSKPLAGLFIVWRVALEYHEIPTKRISRWIYMARCVQEFGQVKNISPQVKNGRTECVRRPQSTAWLIECQGSRGSLNYSNERASDFYFDQRLLRLRTLHETLRERKGCSPFRNLLLMFNSVNHSPRYHLMLNYRFQMPGRFFSFFSLLGLKFQWNGSPFTYYRSICAIFRRNFVIFF